MANTGYNHLHVANAVK